MSQSHTQKLLLWRRDKWEIKDNGGIIVYQEYESELGRIVSIPKGLKIRNWDGYHLLMGIIQNNRKDPSPVYFLGVHYPNG